MRADSGFATPALYEFCEEEKLQYVVGFARNSRLAATVMQADYDDSGEKQRQFTELVIKDNAGVDYSQVPNQARDGFLRHVEEADRARFLKNRASHLWQATRGKPRHTAAGFIRRSRNW